MKVITALGLALALASLSTVSAAQQPAPGAPPAPPAAGPAPGGPPAPGPAPTAGPPPTAYEQAPTPETAPVPEPTPPQYPTDAEQQPQASTSYPAADETPEPPKRRDAGPFSRGSVSLSVLLGTASLGDLDYMILGAGVGYFVVDGLELGLDGSIWLFDSPTIGSLTPQARYVFHMVPVIKPYLGGFFRHYMVGNDIDDFNSVGGRIGAILPMGNGRVYLGAGAVYEHFLDCDDSYFTTCDDWYPEVTVGVSF